MSVILGKKILLAYEKGKRCRQVLVSEWIELSKDNLRIYSDAFVEDNFFQDRGQMSLDFEGEEG